MRRLVLATGSIAAAVAIAAAVGGGRSAVATLILLPAGVALLLGLWRAARAAQGRRGGRRIGAYVAVGMLLLVELWAFAILVWAAAAIGEGLFPFEEHSVPSPAA